MLDKTNTVAVTLPATVRVLMPHGRVEEIKLETYLAGVVATEIGASAPLEALKAQAVASRTYAAAAHRHGEHDADVCTTAHCQKWKRVDPVGAPEVFRALSETWGMVAIFQGKLIDAFFFEHCDGHSRNSEDMLMPAVEYLRGVECSCGFLALKGHGVGMCKRGAIVMARRGASFEQILRHYYRGVVVIHAASQESAPPQPELPVRAAAPSPAEHLPPATPARVAKPAEPLQASPLQPAKNGQAKRAVRRPRKAKGTPAANTPRPVSPPQPASRKPNEDRKPTDSRLEELNVPVEAHQKPPARRSRPQEQKTQKLRGVLVGEVVSESGALNPAKPAKPPRRVQIDHLPGQRMIAGTLPQAGVEIVIEDARGNKTSVMSGSADHYGEGGFELTVEEDGRYLVTIEDQVVEVQVDGETVFIHAA